MVGPVVTLAPTPPSSIGGGEQEAGIIVLKADSLRLKAAFTYFPENTLACVAIRSFRSTSR